jgi:hypothetical protein
MTDFHCLTRIFACAILIALGVAWPGCSRGPVMGTVVGEVTLDGQPLPKGHLEFTPVDGQAQTAGALIEAGKFTATVPVTKMQVKLHAPKVIGKRKMYDTPEAPWEDEVGEALPAKYNNNSDITLDVQRGRQEVRYDLKSK